MCDRLNRPWFGRKGSYDHVCDSEVFFLLLRAIVNFNLNLRVILGRSRVVNEAVGQRVVHYNCEGLLARRQVLRSINELLELRVGCAVALAERISLLKVLDELLQHTLYRSVHATQRARLHLEVNLWDFEQARVALEDVPVHVVRLLHTEGDLGGFG